MPVTTKERILMATRALYVEHGEEGVTMRRVAEAVGLTPTALYPHFDNRNALIAEVVSDGSRVFGSYLYRSLKAPRAGASGCATTQVPHSGSKSARYRV